MLEELNLRVQSMFGFSTYTKGRASLTQASKALFNKSQPTFPALQSMVSLLLSHTLAKLGDIVPKFAFLSSCLDHTVPPSGEHHPRLPWKAHVPGDASGLLVTCGSLCLELMASLSISAWIKPSKSCQLPQSITQFLTLISLPP